MKPDSISLDGVRNRIEGLVNTGVEPVFAFDLDNQVDEEIEDWQCQQRALHGRFRLH